MYEDIGGTNKNKWARCVKRSELSSGFWKQKYE
jgi:hypothetical protein